MAQLILLQRGADAAVINFRGETLSHWAVHIKKPCYIAFFAAASTHLVVVDTTPPSHFEPRLDITTTQKVALLQFMFNNGISAYSDTPPQCGYI
jgi:hypothetical protein